MKMQKTQYTSLIERLSQTSFMVEDGVETGIKPIPDSDRTGDLDPRVFEIVSEYDFSGNPDSESPPFNLEEVRASMGWPNDDVTMTEITTERHVILHPEADIPVRLYRPESTARLPAILFFHGGGFIGGTLDTVENPCKALAEKANAVVISVDYRLAPEHPFPAGLHDCFRAVEWVYDQADVLHILKDEIGVAGDSAGGNLATACCLMDRAQKTNWIHYQALVYPVVNLGSVPTEDFEWNMDQYEVNHHDELIRGIIMSLADPDSLFNDLYLQGKTEVTHPLVSPLLAEDLSDLPPALIITAEYDYLRLEGEAYARKLARDGVRSRLIQYRGMDHAFMDKLGDFPQAEDCMNEIAKMLKEISQ